MLLRGLDSSSSFTLPAAVSLRWFPSNLCLSLLDPSFLSSRLLLCCSSHCSNGQAWLRFPGADWTQGVACERHYCLLYSRNIAMLLWGLLLCLSTLHGCPAVSHWHEAVPSPSCWASPLPAHSAPQPAGAVQGTGQAMPCWIRMGPSYELLAPDASEEIPNRLQWNNLPPEDVTLAPCQSLAPA